MTPKHCLGKMSDEFTLMMELCLGQDLGAKVDAGFGARFKKLTCLAIRLANITCLESSTPVSFGCAVMFFGFVVANISFPVGGFLTGFARLTIPSSTRFVERRVILEPVFFIVCHGFVF